MPPQPHIGPSPPKLRAGIGYHCTLRKRYGRIARVTTMAGLDSTTPLPTDIVLRTQSRVLEIAFDNGARYALPFEFLRVYSPSAEVRGHGAGQETLQTGKRNVLLRAVEPVGNYAVKLVFSDGHDSGLYSWDYLLMLGEQHDTLWQDYLDRLAAENASRDIDTTTRPATGGSCGAGHKH